MIDIIKKLLAMGLPMAATRFIHTFNTFIVMVLLAQLGNEVLAASFSIAMIRIVVLVIFISPLFIIGVFAGEQFSKNKFNKFKTSLFIQQGWLTALILSIIPIIVLSLLKYFLILFKQPVNLIPIISEYFNYYLFSIPAVYISTVNLQFLSGIKKQNWTVVANSINLILGFFFNYSLIFGKFGFPRLEVAGAGLASVITNWTGVLFSTYLVYSLSSFKFNFIRPSKFIWVKKILKTGIPILYKTSSEMLMVLAITFMIGWLGEVAMSASQISSEYLLLALLPVIGLSEACGIVTAHARGEKNQVILHYINYAALIIVTIFTLIIALAFIIFHKSLADLFIDFHSNTAHAIYTLAMWLLAIRIVKMLITGPVQIYLGLLRGLLDTYHPMKISIIINWGITFPLAIILGFVFKFGVIGIIFASIIAEITLVIALFSRWKKIYNKV